MGIFLSKFYIITTDFIRHIFSWFFNPIITNSNRSIQFTSTSTSTSSSTSSSTYISDSNSIEISNVTDVF